MASRPACPRGLNITGSIRDVPAGVDLSAVECNNSSVETPCRDSASDDDDDAMFSGSDSGPESDSDYVACDSEVENSCASGKQTFLFLQKPHFVYYSFLTLTLMCD